MGKKYSQTKKAKEEFTSKILDLLKETQKINPEYKVSKSELCAATGMDDRTVRREIEKVANYYPILVNSKEKGYRIGSFKDTDSQETLKDLYDEVEHTINDTKSRIAALKARLKPLIALQKEIEKRLVK